MTFANVSDVATELGRPTPSDYTILAQWNAWLSRAERIIRVQIPDLDTRVDAGNLDAALVAGIEAAAVARVVRNPDGMRQTSTTIDDGTVSKTRDAVLSDGQLRITDEEMALLLPRRVRGAFSVTPRYSGV